ncbi:protein big brother-like isoform X4 [Neodiprion virginianus]|uniref:protein big brother-like isoform X4 n=1 Tax=Neodiprion fabricii TaxID=2872261 RepID=UPI001ED9280E|nr:protein big brother-like isoform X4 [Neodiprion fabricii]XP_046606263.1 protein big brother-like isoform X4 [Neodiprion virginianus]
MMQMSLAGSEAGAVGGLGVGVLPFDGMGLYEQPRPRFVFKMPRVVPDQKAKFETDELFRRLSRESEVRYTSYHDRPKEEQQVRFQTGCREGHTEIAFAATGTNLQLVFASAASGFCGEPRECDFDKEHGKLRMGMQHQHQQQQQQQAAAARCHTGPSQRHPGLQPNLQARKLKNDLSHGHHN